jgi:hypothetical protein
MGIKKIVPRCSDLLHLLVHNMPSQSPPYHHSPFSISLPLPSNAPGGLAKLPSTLLSACILNASFLLSSSSLSFCPTSSPLHKKLPAPPRPDLATGSSCPSGCQGVLTCGFVDVGMAVESVDWMKVPSFCSSLGSYQLPAPPRPICA